MSTTETSPNPSPQEPPAAPDASVSSQPEESQLPHQAHLHDPSPGAAEEARHETADLPASDNIFSQHANGLESNVIDDADNSAAAKDPDGNQSYPAEASTISHGNQMDLDTMCDQSTVTEKTDDLLKHELIPTSFDIVESKRSFSDTAGNFQHPPTQHPQTPKPITNVVLVPPTQDGSAPSSHALANASLLALAPSLPVIQMSKEIYLSLVNMPTPPLTAPSCCPPMTSYSQFLLIGTRDIINDKLFLDIKSFVPFSSSDTSVLNAFVTHLNKNNNETVLGWAVSTRFDTTALPQAPSQQQPLLDMTCAAIATSYFDLFHSAALMVLSRNCEPLKRDSGLPNLSRFCVEACGFLQDCIGLVCVNRSVLAGNSIMVPFDTPELMPYDVERRLAVITPHLFASIDMKLSKPPATVSVASVANINNVSAGSTENPDSQSQHGTLPSVISAESFPAIPLLPPNLPALIKVHQLPHSTLQVLPSALNAFRAHALRCESVVAGILGDESSQGFNDSEEYARDWETESANILERAVKLGEDLHDELERRVVEYQQSFDELEDMAAVFEALKEVSRDDLAKVLSSI
ncbi:hypothetical protein HDU83_001252 [Entophlyctis luteolus]|nr:hypothetical protein HDU82_005181 [Entophlyctis luteolus]KAJ3348570.1 hypothetical protein HDU83_001252 [Entophlyctis luteolus]